MTTPEPSTTPTPGDAKLRKRVRVSVEGRPTFTAQLTYWPGDHRRRRSKANPKQTASSGKSAVVLTSAGAFIRVPLDAVELCGDVPA